MNRSIIIDLNALNSVVAYLSERPYSEVAGLIQMIKSNIEELPEEDGGSDET